MENAARRSARCARLRGRARAVKDSRGKPSLDTAARAGRDDGVRLWSAAVGGQGPRAFIRVRDGVTDNVSDRVRLVRTVFARAANDRTFRKHVADTTYGVPQWFLVKSVIGIFLVFISIYLLSLLTSVPKINAI